MKEIFKYLITLALIVTFCIPTTCNATELGTNYVESFSDLLKDNDISVLGSDIKMKPSQVRGYVKMFDQKDNYAKTKYNKMLPSNEKSTSIKTSSNEYSINITPEEILELHYYSMKPDERKEFIGKVSNQKVDISMKNDIILISYNVDENKGQLKTMAKTNTYTSSREATIRMQDGVVGIWGSVTIGFRGYFTRTNYSTYCTILASDYDIYKEYEVAPVSIINSQVYAYAGTKVQGAYIGNEINSWCRTQVFCNPNVSQLTIFVYPNSSYNSAVIG